MRPSHRGRIAPNTTSEDKHLTPDPHTQARIALTRLGLTLVRDLIDSSLAEIDALPVPNGAPLRGRPMKTARQVEATAAKLLAEHEPPVPAAKPHTPGRANHPPIVDGRYTLAGIAAATGYSAGYVMQTLRKAGVKPTHAKAPGVSVLISTYDPAQVKKALKARGLEIRL